MSISKHIRYILKNKNISLAFKEFINYCNYKDLSKDTIKFYNESVGYFIDYIRFKKEMLFN